MIRLGESSGPQSALVYEAFLMDLSILSPLGQHKGLLHKSLDSACMLFPLDLKKLGDTRNFILSVSFD